MDWQHKSRHLQIETLRYFEKYNYPLNKKELEFWSGTTVKKFTRNLRLEKIRAQREKYSLLKWGVAYRYASILVKLPFIQAIFVTGSLSMNNCKKSDDIDFMVITDPNTLWIVRFLANILFIKSRRYPNQKLASDKICINLWLDTDHLSITTHTLYHAHEVLQTKCIYDRGGIHKQFLKENSWVKEYLPNAYKNLTPNPSPYFRRGENYHLTPINYLLFVLQYLYMKSKMTSERVGLGYAFFHPK